MFANQRHAKILAALKEKGSVTTAWLTEEFQVSVETVRRDLLQLESQGQLQRVHGGAIAIGRMRQAADLPQRLEDNPAGKAELCETAARLVCDDEVIFVDSGSTAVFFAKALKKRQFSRLTVITHCLDVFCLLSDTDGIAPILCGGHYLRQEKAFYGHLALQTLKHLHAQKAFLFPSAVSLKNGISDFNHELLPVQAMLLENCDHVFILADSEKFECSALLQLSSMSPSFTYITDSALSPHTAALYREQGLHIITCKEDLS